MVAWKTDKCGGCGGHGVVSSYSATDFLGPAECRHCGGGGTVFVSENDRLAEYPGGQFVGFSPGAFAALPESAIWSPDA